MDKRFMVNQALEKVSEYFPNLNKEVKKNVKIAILNRVNEDFESSGSVSVMGCSMNTKRRTDGNLFSKELLSEIVQSAISSDHLFNCKSNTENECPEENFVLEHYITDEDTNVYPYFYSNMGKVYNNLIKIYKYYKNKGQILGEGCSIIVTRGIINSDLCYELFGDRNNPHSKGLALDFNILGKEPKNIFEDIIEGKINLDSSCEVVCLKDSLHLGYNKNINSIKFEQFKEELY